MKDPSYSPSVIYSGISLQQEAASCTNGHVYRIALSNILVFKRIIIFCHRRFGMEGTSVEVRRGIGGLNCYVAGNLRSSKKTLYRSNKRSAKVQYPSVMRNLT